MSLTRWDPFRELEDMSNRLNRVFGTNALRGGQEHMALPDWQPSVDISESAEAFHITAELPQVKKEDIKVSVDNRVLTLKGERHQEKESKDKRYHRVERSYGSFMRTFALPDNVDEAKVKADIKDGVLDVTLPKMEQARPRSVDIKVG